MCQPPFRLISGLHKEAISHCPHHFLMNAHDAIGLNSSLQKSGLVDLETRYLVFASAGFDVHSGAGPEWGSWGVGEASKAIPLTA
jgi:hypothetical protein